jgi:hypothetical protein
VRSFLLFESWILIHYIPLTLMWIALILKISRTLRQKLLSIRSSKLLASTRIPRASFRVSIRSTSQLPSSRSKILWPRKELISSTLAICGRLYVMRTRMNGSLLQEGFPLNVPSATLGCLKSGSNEWTKLHDTLSIKEARQGRSLYPDFPCLPLPYNLS